MFNIKIPVNFSSPYKAENIQDFWARWHMTLTRFFTGYLYIPLGGNRKGTFRTCLNILIVFLVSGIWHGAGYTFILWGLLHGILNVLTRLFHQWKKQIPLLQNHTGFFFQVRRLLAVAATFVAVNIAWVFFRADSVSQALAILRSLFDLHTPGVYAELASFFNLPEIRYILKILRADTFAFSSYFAMIVFCLISAFLIWGCKNIAETENQLKPNTVKCVLLSMLFLYCLISLSGVSSFLYFNF